MSDALKAGSVYVAVTASIGEFTKSMAAVVKQAEETAKKVKESAEFVATVGALFAAGITAAASEATAANAELSRDVERMKALVSTLAGDIGDLFAPAVRGLTDALERAVGVFQRLEPGVKSALASFALFGAGTGVVAAGVAGAAGFVENFAKMMGVTLVPALKAAHQVLPLIGPSLKGLGASLVALGRVDVGQAFTSATAGARGLKASLLGLPEAVAATGKSFLGLVPKVLAVAAPVAAVVAAMAGIAFAAGAVYEAWNDTSTGLREAVLSAVETLKGYAQRLGDFFKGVFTGLRDLFLGLAAAALELVLVQVRQAAAAFEKLLRSARAYDLADDLAKLQSLTGATVVAGLTDTMKAAGEAAGAALKQGVGFVADVGAAAAKNVAESLAYSMKGLRRMMTDAGKATGLSALLDKMEGLLAQLMGGGKATLREEPGEEAHPEVEVSKVGGSGRDKGLTALGLSGMSPMMKAFTEAQRAATEKAREAALEAQRAAQAWKDAAREAFTNKLSSRTGNLQGLVESGAQGAAMGGPVGAAVAVGLDLLTQSQGFQQVITMVNNTIQLVADALGKIIEPLQPLIGALLRLAPFIATSLTPMFSFIGQLLEPLVPVLYMVGEVLEILGPLLHMFSGVLQLVLVPIRLLVDTGLRVLFEAVKYLGVGVLGVARAISWAWNGIVSGIQWVLRGLAKLPFLDALNDVAASLESVKVDRDALKQSQEELLALTYEQARAKAAETAATLKNTQALQAATESLTNVPQAWRVAQRRYESQGASQSPFLPLVSAGAAPTTGKSSATSAPSASTPAPAAAPIIAIDTVNVSGQNTAEALAQLESHLNSLAFRSRGTRAGPGRYAMEGE